MEQRFIYTIKGLTKRYPSGNIALNDVWLSLLSGAKIGVLGLNGAGKTTLLKIIAGEIDDFDGQVLPASGISIGYLSQDPQLVSSETVSGIVQEAVAPLNKLLKRYDAATKSLSMGLSDLEEALNEQGRLQVQIEAAKAWDIGTRVSVAMDALQLPTGQTEVVKLSRGERHRVALCQLLLKAPDLLLLDEPTEHLDAESVSWLGRFLVKYRGTVVTVTNDRYLLDNVADWILELDYGSCIPWEGNYSSWLEQKQRHIKLKSQHKTEHQQALKRELVWIEMSPQARQAKGKTRLSSYNRLFTNALTKNIKSLELYIPPGARLNDVVIEANQLHKADNNRVLINDLSFTLPQTGIVGLIGPAGAGKTTLLRLLAGIEQPDNGSLRIGKTVKVGYMDQSQNFLDPKKTVWDEISGGCEEIMLGTRKVSLQTYLSWFNFKGVEQTMKVGALPRGSLNRIRLAKILNCGSNFLLLDEPTNELDIDTLRSLEDALVEFAGCVVIVSHDRWFLDRIVTHLLVFEGNSKVRWFSGNYTDYELDRRRRLGVEAEQPKRIKFKQLKSH